MSFSKILVANRGEIACRVMRSAHRLGYRTVAVFSAADAQAPHVSLADEAVHIGGSAPSASYLHIEALLAAARRTGADAVHPGYGFLSERADFAQACFDAGLVFIGPPAQAIRAMGNKANAKRRMIEAGVPCAPGYLGEDQSDGMLTEQAHALGTPLLVKAVNGGGGRGMRLVHDLAELPAALEGARREAQNAFGDGTLMLERLIPDGRHIEVQVFADHHGNVVHLGERDCTAQRRRQKVIEEAPSPVVSAAMRQAMGDDAVAAARAVGYRGAGTVEFIVDAQLQHHFLEMNTRLQVEHPVTECVTGLDLVEWQLRIAAGQPLPLRQDQIPLRGHAIEVRLVAEDPYDGWKPQTGRVIGWRPQDSELRIDHGIAQGQEITPHYDALLAKFIAHGTDREDAIRRLVRALDSVPLIGLQQNARFLRDLLLHPQFVASQLSTTRLDEWAAAGTEALMQRPQPDASAWRIAAAVFAQAQAHSQAQGQGQGQRPPSVAAYDITLTCQGQQQTLRAPLPEVTVLSHDGPLLRVLIDGVMQRHHALRDGASLYLAIDAAVFCFCEISPYPRQDSVQDASRALAPVAGTVARVAVAVGDAVSSGQPLVCVEAMKMEMWVAAGAAGTVRAVHVAPRQTVAKGALMIELELTS